MVVGEQWLYSREGSLEIFQTLPATSYQHQVTCTVPTQLTGPPLSAYLLHLVKMALV